MKIKALTAAVSIVSLAWLGISFATPSQVSADSQPGVYLPQAAVDAEHPDSHRLGAPIEEEVVLPDWNAGEVGGEIALLVD